MAVDIHIAIDTDVDMDVDVGRGIGIGIDIDFGSLDAKMHFEPQILNDRTQQGGKRHEE